METINDVQHFLNYSDFVGDLGSDEYSNFKPVKNVLTNNFQDTDSEQLIQMLGVIDDLHIIFLRQDFQDFQPLTEALCERIFTVYEKKTLDE